MDRRSRSTSTTRHHDPYHAVSEVYTKEITHRPIGPASEFPPEILNILREEPRAPHSPPLVRSRENTWTPENFPIVRVPSAQFTDIMTELYDYHEVEKYTRRSMTPEPLHRQQEIVEKAPPPSYHVIPPTPEKNTPRAPGGIPLTSPPEAPKKPLPMYEEYVKMQKENQENRNNIPVSRPRSRSPSARSGSDARNNNNEILRHIDSSSSSSDSFVDHEKSKSLSLKSEQRTEPQFVAPEPPRPSEPTFVKPEEIGKRYVYSHDVYVDSATGRPFTPGREDMKDKKSCDKLKINVYFKPPHPPVEETYKLDEIEIEKQEDILVSKLRPFENSILSRRPSSQPSVSPLPTIPPADYPISSEMEHRRIPTRTTVLRKEHEILTVPLNRSQSVRQSRVSEHSTRRSASRTVTERSIPIHLADDKESIDMDEIFPKMPHHQTVTNVHGYPQSRSSTRSHGAASHGVGSIDKGDIPRHRPTLPKNLRPESVQSGTPELPLTRGLSKTPSDKDYRLKEDYKVKRPSERSPSFVSSHAPSHKTERTPSEVRIPITVATSAKLPQKRESPEELDYGRFQSGKPEQVKELSPTRGISKTPSDKDFQKYNPPKDVHIPYNNPEKERVYQQQLHQEKPKDVHIPYNNPEKERAYQQQQLAPKSAPSVRSSYRSQHTSQSQKSETPELPYTRGLTRTPSDKDVQSVTDQPDKPKEVHVPYNNLEKERAYQQAHGPKRVPSGRTHSPSKRTRSPGSKHRPSASHSGPFEEIVHIKERYERDETIRRFFPTTTTV
ncbi:unnamed protein product [Caenorhabditis brenneri]